MRDFTKSSFARLLVLCCWTQSIEGLKSAVVVGAGPAGLASALVLAKRHGYQVTVLESSERTDVYDPTKAYPFLIRERGQKLTNMFPEVQKALETQGIETSGATKLVSIPADPNQILDPEPKEIPIFRPAGKSFWIRRHEFIRLLLEAARAEENITVINGATCSKISASGDSEIEICTEGSTNLTLKTSLLIGCDGMKSKVRESLAASPSFFPRWRNNDPAGFNIKRWFSPASGLKFKCLQINSDAKVPVGDGTMFEIPFDTQTFYSIRSVYKKPKQAISLGLLPCRKAPTRTFNVIRPPNHDIWKVKDGKELRAWFAKAFPRFDFSSESSSLVDQEEFDRFASTPGLSLPPCQYSPELYTVSRNSEAAVILVGDAVHTFPPDLGEGVNSGLEDVVCLDESLRKLENLGDAARYYGSLRGPESKALVKMVRVGAPFQYQQFGGMLTVKRLLWTFNFFGRVALNKLTFGLTPLPVFIQIADPKLKYSTALRRADTLTSALWLVTLGVLSRVFGIASKLKALFM